MTALTLFEVTGNWLSVSAPALSGNNSDPRIEKVTGLVNFRARVPQGTTFLVNDYLVTSAYNTRQQVWLVGNPIMGTFRLWLDGYRTAELAYNASATQVKAALASLPPINGLANLQVTSGPGDAFTIEFIGALANANVPIMRSTSSMANANGQNCPVSVTLVTQGTPTVTADTAISLPDISARIWNGRLAAINSVDSAGVKLTANSAALNNPDPLIYDVSFDKVRFNSEEQVIAPFAFLAPTTATSISLTDPAVNLLPYEPPLPATVYAAAPNNWRLRAVV